MACTSGSTPDPFVSASQALVLQFLWGIQNETQGFMHAKQVFYQTILSLFYFVEIGSHVDQASLELDM